MLKVHSQMIFQQYVKLIPSDGVAFSVESLFSSSCHQVSMNRESDDSKVIHLLKKYFYEVIVTMQGRKIKYFDTKVKN